MRWFISYLISTFLILSSLMPQVALGRSPFTDLNPKTRDYMKALSEGADGETISDLYGRILPMMAKPLRVELETYLKDKGHLTAPLIDLKDNVLTFRQNNVTATVKIESVDGENVVTFNGRKLAKSDFSSVKSVFSRMEQILKEDLNKQTRRNVRGALMSVLFFESPANAAFDMSTVLLGAAAGGLIGFGFGGIAGAAMGAGIGLLGGMFISSMMNQNQNTTSTCVQGLYLVGSSCVSGCQGTVSGTPVSSCPVANSAPVRIADTPVYKGTGAGVQKAVPLNRGPAAAGSK